MLRTKRSLWTVVIGLVVFFLGVMFYGWHQDNVFKKNARLAIPTIRAADPIKLCTPTNVFSTPGGYYATCVTAGVNSLSSVYSVVVTFYPSREDAEVKPPQEIGKEFLVFGKQKPRHLISANFRRPDGSDIN
jgi:predicted membrane channel-forming protein YqfA (hemolysin III family)